MDKDSFGSDLVGRAAVNVNEYLLTDASSINGVPPPQCHRLFVDDVNEKVRVLLMRN
jgi:hypothetical protein